MSSCILKKLVMPFLVVVIELIHAFILCFELIMCVNLKIQRVTVYIQNYELKHILLVSWYFLVVKSVTDNHLPEITHLNHLWLRKDSGHHHVCRLGIFVTLSLGGQSKSRVVCVTKQCLVTAFQTGSHHAMEDEKHKYWAWKQSHVTGKCSDFFSYSHFPMIALWQDL